MSIEQGHIYIDAASMSGNKTDRCVTAAPPPSEADDPLGLELKAAAAKGENVARSVKRR